MSSSRCVSAPCSALWTALVTLKNRSEPSITTHVVSTPRSFINGTCVWSSSETQVPLMNDLGVDTTWVVIEGSDRFFNVTKAVHNALQGAETHLDDDMRETYWERMHANAAELPDDFDVVLVHDPQPAALLHVLEEGSRRKGK